jgi:phosphatidylglycerophosphate synthase
MSMARTARRSPVHGTLLCILPAAVLTGAIAQLWTNLLALDAAYLAKAMAVFAVGAALVLNAVPKHHPFGSFGAANQVTVARGALVALLAGLIAERDDTGAPLLAVAMAVIVAVLDGLDGWLARRNHMSSAFGARFDMETDALLIMVLALLAWQFGKAGVWVLASGLLRYIFVAAAMGLPFLRRALPPSRRRKTIAVVQTVALILTIAPFVPAAAGSRIAAVGLVALSLSFLVDFIWLIQNAA